MVVNSRQCLNRIREAEQYHQKVRVRRAAPVRPAGWAHFSSNHHQPLPILCPNPCVIPFKTRSALLHAEAHAVGCRLRSKLTDSKLHHGLEEMRRQLLKPPNSSKTTDAPTNDGYCSFGNHSISNWDLSDRGRSFFKHVHAVVSN